MTRFRQQIPAFLLSGYSTLKPTLLLFGVDTLANLIDYLFHIYLGRALVPGDFAVFQTVNSALLIAVTAFGVMQPVLARLVAELEVENEPRSPLSESSRLLFRTFFRWSGWIGLALAFLFWSLAGHLGVWLNVPLYVARYGALVVIFVLLRPVVAGTLQGTQRFISFGITRLAYAAGRFAFAALVVSAGAGLAGAVASLPIGQVLAVAAGLGFLGSGLLKGESGMPPPGKLLEGFRLAGFAFVAYAAYTALQNMDLLWANRLFDPDEAGAYAAAVLLRRVLILLPGAATVVMYPRVVASVTRGELPDRLLSLTLALVVVAVAGLAAAYWFFGDWIVAAAFGPGYEAAGSLLGVMGLGMIGFAVSSVWMSLFLATRPAIFVGFLVLTTLLQAVLLAVRNTTPGEVVGVFAASGWLLAAVGGLIYLAVLRPALKGASA